MCENTYEMSGETAARIPAILGGGLDTPIPGVPAPNQFFDADPRIFAEILKCARRGTPAEIDAGKFLPRSANRDVLLPHDHRIVLEIRGWGYPCNIKGVSEHQYNPQSKHPWLGLRRQRSSYAPKYTPAPQPRLHQTCSRVAINVSGQIVYTSEQTAAKIPAVLANLEKTQGRICISNTSTIPIDGCGDYFRLLCGFARWNLPVNFLEITHVSRDTAVSLTYPPTQTEVAEANWWGYPWIAHNYALVDCATNVRGMTVNYIVTDGRLTTQSMDVNGHLADCAVVHYLDGEIRGLSRPKIDNIIAIKKEFTEHLIRSSKYTAARDYLSRIAALPRLPGEKTPSEIRAELDTKNACNPPIKQPCIFPAESRRAPPSTLQYQEIYEDLAAASNILLANIPMNQIVIEGGRNGLQSTRDPADAVNSYMMGQLLGYESECD